MNTDSKIWKALNEMGMSARDSKTTEMVAEALDELASQQAAIKALADALWDARQYGDEPEDLCWCQAPCAYMAWRNPKCEGKVATLRLAGRL